MEMKRRDTLIAVEVTRNGSVLCRGAYELQPTP